MNLIGISYKQSPVEVREKLVLTKSEQIQLLNQICQNFPISEVFILTTCNRTEIYYYTKSKANKVLAQEIFSELLKLKNLKNTDLPLFEKKNEKAYQHFFRVACGLESMVLGETQILKQIKEAMLVAKTKNFFGAQLEFLFQRMFYITKKIRSETKISANAISVGSTAVKLTKTIFDDLSKKRVMVIGAGETTELILQHLVENGTEDITITNRTFENALRLAKKFEGSAVWYKDRYRHILDTDIIISSTHAPEFVIEESLCQDLLKRKTPVFFIDIAVPRDIDPQIGKLANCYLYHIDDLQKVVFSNYDLRKKESKKVEAILEKELEVFLHYLNWKKSNFLIKSLQIKYQKMAAQELEIFLSKQPALKKNKAELENLIYRMQKKFLHNPYLFLKDDCTKESKKTFSNIFDIPFFENKESKSENNIIQIQRKNEQKI